MLKSDLHQKLMEKMDELFGVEKHPLMVFDLDATLFDVGPRIWHILREYADQHEDEEFKKALQVYRKTRMPFLIRDILAQMEMDTDDRIENVTPHWFDRFYTDPYQHYDVPLPGAVSFVQSVYDKGASIVYLTGRDASGMLVGCAESLRRHGFPVGLVRTHILMKHDFDVPDPTFKEDACGYIETLGTVASTFDNEPGNCNIFQKCWPDAVNVFLDTQRAAMDEMPKEGIFHLDNFDFLDS